jgi:hypothetical protein
VSREVAYIKIYNHSYTSLKHIVGGLKDDCDCADITGIEHLDEYVQESVFYEESDVISRAMVGGVGYRPCCL